MNWGDTDFGQQSTFSLLFPLRAGKLCDAHGNL